MRKEFKQVIKIVVTFIIISMFGIYVYAENIEVTDPNDNTSNNIESGNNEENTGNNLNSETENNTVEEVPKENENTNNENNSNNTNNNSQTVTKSNNANLSNLGINPHDFSGFTPSNTVYNVIVPEETKTIEIYAQVANSKATVTGSGTKNLEIGKNAFILIVTAEDGTKKTYTINVTRDGNESTTNEESEDKDLDVVKTTENLEVIGGKEGLKTLSVEEAELSPNFKANIYEYTLKYEGNLESLKIDFEPVVSTYVVEIMGNNTLVEGDNVISIFVSDESGNNIATYQIIVDKYLVLETETINTSMYIWIGIVIIFVLLILIVIIKKIVNRKKIKEHLQNKNKDNSYVDEQIEELPKGLVKNNSNNKNLEDKKIIDSNLEEKERFETEKQINKNQFLNEYESKLNNEEKI